MSEPVYDIAVVGAGPIGAGFALGLARMGLDTALIDGRDPGKKSYQDIRNFAIVSGNWDFLTTIGLTPALEQDGQPLHGLEAVDGGTYGFGRPSVLFMDSDLADSGPDRPLGYMVTAERLQITLDQAMAGQTGLTCFMPERFVGLDYGAGYVRLHLQNTQSIRARLVVGADGVGSPVRAALGIGVEKHDYPRSVFTANVKTDRPHHGIARQLFTPQGPFATLPLKDGRINFAWYLKCKAAETLADQPIEQAERELNARFAAFAGKMVIEKPGYAYPLKLQIAERIIGRRAALIGDAARRINPLAGQGLNQGLRDSAALLAIIGETWRTGGMLGSKGMLQCYSRNRRFDGASMALALDGIDRLFANDWLLTKSVRRLGLTAASRVAPLRRALARKASGLS